MSSTAELLADAFGRINEGTAMVVDGLSVADLTHRVAPEANTIGWLAWHIARGQDAQVADVAGSDEVWTSSGWAKRFGLPFDDAAMGYGQTPEEVGAVNVPAELLVGYTQAVTDVTLAYVRQLSDSDLDRVVDESWDPPVTLGVRLLSIIGDDLKHLGQAEYIRGLL